MTLVSLPKILIAGLAASTALSAFADTKLKQYADWSLFESSDGKSCYISADNLEYGNNGVTDAWLYLTISKVKNSPEKPAEVFIRYTESGKNQSAGATVNIDGSSFNTVDLDGGRKNYWGVGKNLSQLIQKIKDGRGFFNVTAAGRGMTAKLTTSGFTDILREMESSCNRGNSIIDTQFESVFFGNVTQLDSNKVDPSKAQSLRKLYYEAYEANFHIRNANAELQVILDKYKPFSDELTVNRNQTNNIRSRLIPEQQTILSNSQQQQVQATADIQRLQALIVNLQAKVAQSQKAFDQAKAILAPFQPQYNDITSRLDRAQTLLSQSQDRLSYIDSRSTNLESQIRNLNSELQNLNQGLSYKQRLATDAYNAYMDAQRQRSSFDSQREVQDRLRRDYQYDQMRRDLDQTRFAKRDAERQLQQFTFERDSAERALNQCRAQAPHSVDNPVVGVIGAIENPPRRGPGGPGGPGIDPRNPGAGPRPPVNPIQPPVQPGMPIQNCTQQENEYNRTQSQWMNQNNVVAQWRDRERNLEYRVRDIEQRVSSEVNYQYNQLVNIENQALSTYQSRNRDLQMDQQRIEQINRVELPNADRELANLRNERPSVVNDIQVGQRSVATINQELASFKASCDWDTKYNQVQTTGATLRNDQNDLSRAEFQLREAQGRLSQGIATEQRAKAQIDSLQNQATALDRRAVELNAKLAELPAERAQFDRYIADQKSIYETKRNEFISKAQ